nr:hypothetical protein Q903MT_gene2419 [Picea sitchensis]
MLTGVVDYFLLHFFFVFSLKTTKPKQRTIARPYLPSTVKRPSSKNQTGREGSKGQRTGGNEG